MNENVKPTRPRREPSLLERAANVYDFQSYVRVPEVRDVPGAPAPAPTPLAEEPERTPPAPPVEAAPTDALPVDASPIDASPIDAAPPGPVEYDDPEPPFVDHAPFDPSLSGIPAEFLAQPGDDEFLATEYSPGFSDVAMVDRAMLAENGMIVPGAPIGPLAEEFRLVKRQLIITSQRLVEGGDEDKARVVLVCSARPQDGKTFCSVNLALSLAAERDTEVLLIDADVAKPDVLGRLGLNEGPGLLDALVDGSIDVESLVMRTDVPHLAVLPCGTRTANDTELLASARTRAVVQRLLSAPLPHACAASSATHAQRDAEESAAKKPRVVWTVEMHQQFVQAVNTLGIDSAWPPSFLLARPLAHCRATPSCYERACTCC